MDMKFVQVRMFMLCYDTLVIHMNGTALRQYQIGKKNLALANFHVIPVMQNLDMNNH